MAIEISRLDTARLARRIRWRKVTATELKMDLALEETWRIEEINALKDHLSSGAVSSEMERSQNGS